jgi:3-oxoacyl-[acyl-carrier-protein] synthase-3
VQAWRADRARNILDADNFRDSGLSRGVQLTLEALSDMHDDPFQGARERRLMPEGVLTSDMELIAARAAMQDAAVDPHQIDCLLEATTTPDYLAANNACLLQHELRLPARCFTTSIEAASNAFLMQLELARSLIFAGSATTCLLVQSTAMSRLVPTNQSFSTWFGDGATAVVVGRVADGAGILASTHLTDGSRHRALVCGVPGRRWYDEGRAVMYPADAALGRETLMTGVDRATEIIDQTLQAAQLSKRDVQFFACHQATSWLRRLTQEAAGLSAARFCDTFEWTGSLWGANVPFVLSHAVRNRLLSPGDLALLVSPGAGETWSCVALRWAHQRQVTPGASMS